MSRVPALPALGQPPYLGRGRIGGHMRLLLAAVLLVAVLAPAADADWPAFRNDARKTGAQGGTDYQVYKDVWWSTRIPGNTTVEASPVVAGGIVLIGGWDKVIRAYDAASGKERWNYTMTDKVVASPAIQSGRVYAVDVKGALVSLDLQTGRKYAETTVGLTLAPVTAHEGKLFIGTESGEMKAYEVKSSDSVITLLWTFNVAAFRAEGMAPTAPACIHAARPIRSAVAVHDGIVYFGAMNNHLYAVNEEGESDASIRAQWTNQTADIVLATPTVDITNSRVYFASYDGKLRGFSLTRPNPASCGALNRLPTWTYTAPSNAQMRSSPAFDGTNLYVGTNSGRVLAVAASTGTELWNTGTGDIVVSSPAVANGIVVIGSDDKYVYWIAAGNGTVLKRFPAEGAIKSSPAVDGSRAFVASFDGTVYMFGPEIPTRADLVVESITRTDSGIAIVVKNQGDAASVATTLRILQDGSTFIANLALEAIGPGESRTLTQAVTLDGPTTFKAIADPDGNVTESADQNNEREEEISPPEPEPTDDGGDGDGDGDGDGGDGGLKIPGPGVPLALLALAGMLVLRRRR
jgi:outer membrane protein assembly factor BamB